MPVCSPVSQSTADSNTSMFLQEANQRNVDPLQPHEIRVIDEQLRFLGKQPKRWEIIVSQHLPYRTVSHVSKLWAAHQASLQESSPGEGLMKSVAFPQGPFRQCMSPSQPSCCWKLPIVHELEKSNSRVSVM